MRITSLLPDDEVAIVQTARLLVDGFKQYWPDAWPTIEIALVEVRQSFGPGRISRIAVDDSATVLGWVGGISQYDGHVWELHPLVVHGAHRRQGIGRALVADLEAQVRMQGGQTLWLGTDDEAGMTSLGGINLYPDVLGHLQAIRNLRGHPYEFYQKLGFAIVGVLPDANGPGKPDIYMAKSVVKGVGSKLNSSPFTN
ncbi:MAG: aminoglycoside N-acetyltransferase AAC(6')-Ii [Anaerolineae bacterium]